VQNARYSATEYTDAAEGRSVMTRTMLTKMNRRQSGTRWCNKNIKGDDD